MQLNELIEQEGLEKVALKTTISQDNLKYMVDEKFEKLSRVKALGFLVILEREYKELESSELKNKIKLYFEENKPDHDNVIVITEASSTNKEFSFFKWFVILGILFGGYYLYMQGSLEGLLQNITNKKDIYSDDAALENNITVEEAKNVSVTKDVKEPVSIVAPVEPIIDLKVEENSSKVETEATPVTVQAVVAEELDKLGKSTDTQIAEESSEVEEVVTPTISTITINPTRGMLWFGFINVETKKKEEFMKQVSTPFDINNGKWILVTGHGFVDVVSELKTVEVSDRNKHYFYIDANELKEISQKEFRTLNDGHGWI